MTASLLDFQSKVIIKTASLIFPAWRELYTMIVTNTHLESKPSHSYLLIKYAWKGNFVGFFAEERKERFLWDEASKMFSNKVFLCHSCCFTPWFFIPRTYMLLPFLSSYQPIHIHILFSYILSTGSLLFLIHMFVVCQQYCHVQRVTWACLCNCHERILGLKET